MNMRRLADHAHPSLAIPLALLVVSIFFHVLPHQFPVLAVGAVIGVAAVIVTASAFGGRPWALIVYLFIIIVTSEMNLRTRDFSDYSIDLQTGIKALTWVGAMMVGLGQIHSSLRLVKTAPIACLFSFMFVCVVSSVYADNHLYALVTSVAFASFVFLSLSVVSILSSNQIILTVLFSIYALIIASLALQFWSPATAELTQWTASGPVTRLTGVTGHPNALGGLAAIGLLLSYAAFTERIANRGILTAGAVVALIALLESQSRTAIFALPMIGLGYLLLKGRLIVTLPSLVGLIAMLICVLALAPLTEIATSISRSGSAEEITSLTGRVELWSFAVDAIADAPLLGYGVGSSRELISTQWVSTNGWTTTHAHNLILQSMINVGIIGTSLLLIIFTWHILHLRGSSNHLATLGFGYIAITGLTGSSVLSLNPTTVTLVWLLGLCSLALETSSEAKGRTAPLGQPRTLSQSENSRTRASLGRMA